MPDVDAFGGADPHPARQRLVHVTEEREPGLGAPDRGQQRVTAALHPPRHGVVEQFGHRGRDMGAEHVDRADLLDLGGVGLFVDLVGRPVPGDQAAADESERPAVQIRPRAVET